MWVNASDGEAVFIREFTLSRRDDSLDDFLHEGPGSPKSEDSVSVLIIIIIILLLGCRLGWKLKRPNIRMNIFAKHCLFHYLYCIIKYTNKNIKHLSSS